MTENQRLQITEIAIQATKNNNPLHLFSFYAHSLISLSCYQSSSNKFMEYYDAWCSSFAAPMRKYLDYVPIINLCRETLNNMAEILNIDFVTPAEYVESICPTLFTGSTRDVFFFLLQQNMTSFRDSFYACVKVIAVDAVHSQMYRMPFPSLASLPRINSESISAFIFENYESFKAPNEQYKNLKFNNNDLFQLWLLMYGFDYKPEPVKRSIKINRIVEKLNNEGVSNEQQLQIFILSKVYDILDTKKNPVDHPYRYLRKIFMSKDESDTIDQNNDNPTSPSDQFFASEKGFDESVQTLRKTDPLDFIRSLYFGQYRNDIAIENGFIFQRLHSKLNDMEMRSALIIMPNPDFVEKCMSDPWIDSNKLQFVFNSEYLAALYAFKFPNGHFAFFESVDESWSIQMLEQTTAVSKVVRYSKKSMGKDYQIALFFARDLSKDAIQSLLLFLKEHNLQSSGSVFLHIPNAYMDNKTDDFRKDLLSEFKCKWIVTFDPSTSSAGLKKKCLLSLITDSKKSKPTIPLLRFAFFKDTDQQQKYYLQPWPIHIPFEKLLENSKTLNQLWKESRPRDTALGEQRKTRCYVFSKEIPIWYSWSPKSKRGRIYFSAIPNEKQLQYNPMSRGKRLTPFYEYSAQSENSAENTAAAQVLGNNQMLKTIQKEIARVYRNKPMSLKSYWVSILDALFEKTLYDHEVAQRLFSNKKLSDFMSDVVYSLEDYMSCMSESFTKMSQSEQLAQWTQLNLILQYGATQRRFIPNPISEYLSDVREKDAAYREVRDALAKRSFSRDEEMKIISYFNKQLPENGLFLSCAIRFYTGMSNDEVCALEWGDFFQIFPEGECILLVTKIMHPGGKITSEMSNPRTRMRRVPVVSSLADILKRRKRYVQEKLTASNPAKPHTDTAFRVLPIVTEDSENFSEPCSLQKAASAAKTTVTAAEISPFVINLPDKNESSKETDLNEYHGDIFRSNFKYRTSQTCKMLQAEINYMLGLSMPNTFSKHYCDYSNDFSQLMLIHKLQRWVTFQHGNHCIPATEEKINLSDISSPTEIKFTGKHNARFCIDLDLQILQMTAGLPASLLINVKSKHGIDAVFNQYAKENK